MRGEGSPSSILSIVQRSAVLNIAGLSRRLIGEDTPSLTGFMESNSCCFVEPAFPAVTCTAQATYLTGKLPSEHGIVANGWYDSSLAEHQFWRQSNHLVGGAKLWEVLQEKDPEFTCAKLFWWFNMYSTADFSITPRPIYPADGRKVFDIYTCPMDMREQLKADLGDFPFAGNSFGDFPFAEIYFENYPFADISFGDFPFAKFPFGVPPLRKSLFGISPLRKIYFPRTPLGHSMA